MAKVGRNESCPCGSGKKYKQCCQSKTEGNRSSKVVMVVIGAALVAAMVATFFTDRDAGAGPGRVWSAEHGHYH